jgi:adenylate cyclase
MPIERERKFLVRDESWRPAVTSKMQIKQGYIAITAENSVRVRKKAGVAFLTIKAGTDPLKRLEFEYEIPVADADTLFDNVCEKRILQKIRHQVPGSDGLMWEVDEFGGRLEGLVLAEIELPGDIEEVDLPSWVGQEVTHDTRYLNANLATHDPRSADIEEETVLQS